jgi:tetratricopeptide (TPR) repeat protein
VLQDAVPAPELVTLSRSVTSGFMPVQYRFVADHLAALWKGHGDAAHYERLFEAAVSGRDEAGRALAGELEVHPECPATHFLYSAIAPDREDAERHAGYAAELCPDYGADPLREACGYPNRLMSLDDGALDRLLRAVREAPGSGRGALLSAAVGLLCCSRGRLDEAYACYRRAGDEYGEHPELALALAKALLAQGLSTRTTGLLSAALRDNKTCTQANVILGQVCLRGGDPARAREYFGTALARAPAWNDILPLMACAEAATGSTTRGETVRRRYVRRQRVLDSLAGA